MEEQLDEFTNCIYLELPASKVVLLQAHFELYEGVATIRTLKTGERPLVSVITTQSMRDTCLSILESLKEELSWCAVDNPICRESRAD